MNAGSIVSNRMARTMTSPVGPHRRDILQLSVAATLVGAPSANATPRPASADIAAYSALLKVWCDGLLDQQIRGLKGSGVNGALLCPACGIVHGRCADAVYPLLRVARSTGDSRYMDAARAVQSWSESHVSRSDGSWVNDPVLSDWKGITVFRVAALAEALVHHGDLLDAPTRKVWRTRLAQACRFLESFITIDTGNINYPVSSAYAFSLSAEALGRSDYEERAKGLAHASLDYFTPNGLLFGEGHPHDRLTPKGQRPVDLGYNVEESLPALALYGLRTDDAMVMEQVVASLRAHMEFMLPDGAWDNSWGSRNYKWTWWGSRTSDGCHAAYRLLADRDPRFAEVSARNLALMADCTHDGLLSGGPHYRDHGYAPCIHHTFSHAKALATVIDLAGPLTAVDRTLPRDTAYGLKRFQEVGTHLAAVGPWRATFTDYDFDYLSPAGGGHASGGAVSLLHHTLLGPVLASSMTRYKVVETANQQTPQDATHQVLTARVELVGREDVSSLNDMAAELIVEGSPQQVRATARGRLLTPDGQAPNGGPYYDLVYELTPTGFTVQARVVGLDAGTSTRLVLPVISRRDERVSRPSPSLVEISKRGGRLIVKSLNGAFSESSDARIFNLVPGLEALALRLPVGAEGVTIRIVAKPFS